MSVSPGLRESAFLSKLCQRLLVAPWYQIHKMHKAGYYKKSSACSELEKTSSYNGTHKVYKRYLTFLDTLQTLTRTWLL